MSIHSTSKILGRLAGRVEGVSSETPMAEENETVDVLDAPQLKPSFSQKMEHAVKNALGYSCSNKPGPMDNL